MSNILGFYSFKYDLVFLFAISDSDKVMAHYLNISQSEHYITSAIKQSSKKRKDKPIKMKISSGKVYVYTILILSKRLI